MNDMEKRYVTHFMMAREFIAHTLKLRVSGYRYDAIQNIVLFKEVGEHSRGAQRVDVGGNQHNNRCCRRPWRSSVFRDDVSVGFGIRWT